jgi:hypothetical protein
MLHAYLTVEIVVLALALVAAFAVSLRIRAWRKRR